MVLWLIKQAAIKWFKLAADQGVAPAQYSLGVLYHQGEVIEQDDKQALKWHSLAAEQGFVGSQYNL